MSEGWRSVLSALCCGIPTALVILGGALFAIPQAISDSQPSEVEQPTGLKIAGLPVTVTKQVAGKGGGCVTVLLMLACGVGMLLASIDKIAIGVFGAPVFGRSTDTAPAEQSMPPASATPGQEILEPSSSTIHLGSHGTKPSSQSRPVSHQQQPNSSPRPRIRRAPQRGVSGRCGDDGCADSGELGVTAAE